MHHSELLTTVESPSRSESTRWYAIADAAQYRSLPSAISTEAASRCLLGGSPGSPTSSKSPHLVLLPAPSTNVPAWQWIDRHAKQAPCITVIESSLGFDALFEHLRRFTTIVLPDGEDLFFAFWTPQFWAVWWAIRETGLCTFPGPCSLRHSSPPSFSVSITGGTGTGRASFSTLFRDKVTMAPRSISPRRRCNWISDKSICWSKRACPSERLRRMRIDINLGHFQTPRSNP